LIVLKCDKKILMKDQKQKSANFEPRKIRVTD
jgi:hypothetical protein